MALDSTQPLTEMSTWKLAIAVRLMNYIQEVPGSNLGRGTKCPKGFRGFLQSFQANAGIVAQLRHDHSRPHS
jgi:hypothetical protein